MENVNSIYNNNSISNNTDIYTDIYTDNNIKEKEIKEKEKYEDCWLWNGNSDEREHPKPQNNDNPFNLSDEMIEIVNEWKAYKKERRQPYKPKGEIMFIRKLLKLSNGSTELARQIVEDAMANNYQGIFPLKNQQQRSKCDATGAVINVNDAWNNG